MRRPDVSACQIKAIKVYCSTATKMHVGWPYVPGSVTTAQMNLAFCAASFILDREVFTRQFQIERLTNRHLLRITRLIHVLADPGIDRKGERWRHAVRLVLKLNDGTTEEVEVQHARGSEDNPISPLEVKDKYRRLAAKKLAGPDLEAIMQNVLDLEHFARARDAFRPLFGRP